MRFLHNILAKAGLIVDGVTQLNTIANATIDTDKFLVSDGGVIKYRTGAQLGSDIGAANLAASTLKHQVKLGEAINKGQAVYVSSADGTNMIVSKASNASEPTSSKTLGLIETSGVLNDQVNVVTEGLLAGLDTSTAAAGDPVWLGTGGNLIFGLANKPYAPAHLVFIGIVTRVQQNNGEIFVKVQNGFELKEIHDVQITTTPSDNTVLAYESATSLYKMKSIATLLGYTPANAARQLTINGTTYDLTADRTWSVGTVTSIATTGPITGGTITGSGTIGITQATTSSNGYLSSTDWNTFNNKQNALTLTTTGSSGASTLVGATLNIPTYSLSGLGGVPSSRQLTINGTAYDLSADRSWSVGTVTSVGVSVPTGLSVSNTPVTGSGTIAISFTAGYSIPTTASQTNWDTAYNNRITSLTTTGTSGAATLTSNTLNIPQYQAQGSYITSLTGEATASGPGAASVTLTNSAVIGKVLTGLNVTGGSISATDSILTAFGKLQNQVNGLAGGVTYQGTWNASTNSPSLTSSVGTKGYYYVVSVAGSTNLNGITDWKLGDWAIFNGTSWEKVDNTDAVVSVNGFTGAVSLTTSNISEGTNLYYTDARARAAISLTTTGSSGAATYTGGVLNIPQYSLSGLGGVPTSRQLTINGTAYDLSADRTWTITNISGNSATTSQTNFSSLTVNSNTVLHAGNYNSYAPTLTGTGASGTWGINITGSATTWNGLNFNGVSSRFTGDLNTLGLSGTSGIYNIGTGYTNGPSSGLYGTLFGIWNADISVQFWASYNGNFYWRKSVGNTYTGSTWLTLLDSSNYNSYSPTLTGGGASGTWGISITGNAATATSATNLYGAGGSYIQSTSSGTSYTANYQVRENSGGGSNTNEIYAPQLAFHWSGVVASSIMMESSGRIAIRNNPGSGYESFIAYDVYGSNSMRAPQFRFTNSSNNAYLTGNSDWGFRVVNDNGYIQFGPANGSWSHIYSDKSFYFNQELYINGTQVVKNTGTWGISITGNAATATTASGVAWSNVSSKPAGWLNTTNLIDDYAPQGTAVPSGFYQNYNGSGNPTGTWFNYINVRHSNPANGHGFQIGMSYYDSNLWFRSYQGGTSPTFASWSRALGTQTDPYPSNMNQYVRTTDTVSFGKLDVNFSGSAVNGIGATHTGSISSGQTAQAFSAGWSAYGASFLIAYKQGELSPSDMCHIYNIGGFYMKIYDGSTNRFHRWDDNGSVSINSSSQGSYIFNTTCYKCTCSWGCIHIKNSSC